MQHRQPVFRRRDVLARLSPGIARGHKEHPLELKARTGLLGQDEVADVGRIERAAEDA
jgi:hypothetical protein